MGPDKCRIDHLTAILLWSYSQTEDKVFQAEQGVGEWPELLPRPDLVFSDESDLAEIVDGLTGDDTWSSALWAQTRQTRDAAIAGAVADTVG
jgi:hypothetical protein